MQGKVSIYKGYEENNKYVVDPEPIFSENNLIVDGFKEHIVDMLTRVPYPSTADDISAISGTYDVSNFGVHAITLSPNESGFSRVHALAGLSGYVADSNGATQPQIRCLDVSDGLSWSYNKDITNHLFSAVNYPSATVPVSNCKLENPSFSSLTPHLVNGTFRDYYLDESLSSMYINEFLSLYELPGWDINSWYRYEPLAENFDVAEFYRAGSCSRYDMSAVSGVYSILSGTSATDTYAEPDDGILYVRSYEPNTSIMDSSALVSL